MHILEAIHCTRGGGNDPSTTPTAETHIRGTKTTYTALLYYRIDSPDVTSCWHQSPAGRLMRAFPFGLRLSGKNSAPPLPPAMDPRTMAAPPSTTPQINASRTSLKPARNSRKPARTHLKPARDPSSQCEPPPNQREPFQAVLRFCHWCT